MDLRGTFLSLNRIRIKSYGGKSILALPNIMFLQNVDKFYCVLWISWIRDINSGWLFRNLGSWDQLKSGRIPGLSPILASISLTLNKRIPSTMQYCMYTQVAVGASLIGQRLRKCDSEFRLTPGWQKFLHRHISTAYFKVYWAKTCGVAFAEEKTCLRKKENVTFFGVQFSAGLSLQTFDEGWPS